MVGLRHSQDPFACARTYSCRSRSQEPLTVFHTADSTDKQNLKPCPCTPGLPQSEQSTQSSVSGALRNHQLPPQLGDAQHVAKGSREDRTASVAIACSVALSPESRTLRTESEREGIIEMREAKQQILILEIRRLLLVRRRDCRINSPWLLGGTSTGPNRSALCCNQREATARWRTESRQQS